MKKIRGGAFCLLVALLLGVALFSGWKLIDYYAESYRTRQEYEELSQLRQEGLEEIPTHILLPEDPVQGPEPSAPSETEPADPYAGLLQMTHVETGKEVWLRPEFASLFAINPDIIGWIRVEGTHIDYPVVQRKDRTDYYLYRDFYGKQVMRGCIYAREACDVLAPSDNVILYGHMMKDNTMFADLNHYTDRAFWQEHRYIRFDTLLADGLYEVISVFKTSGTLGKGFRYHLFVDAASPEELDSFWNSCQELEFYDTGLDPVWGDKLLTLSTCEYTLENGRLVVVARRVEEGSEAP